MRWILLLSQSGNELFKIQYTSQITCLSGIAQNDYLQKIFNEKLASIGCGNVVLNSEDMAEMLNEKKIDDDTYVLTLPKRFACPHHNILQFSDTRE